jgi:hypothetical protein
MKKLRTLIIGMMLGGGLGAKIGSFTSTFEANSNTWSPIEMGFLMGSVIGMCIAAAIMFINAEVTNQRQ